MPQSVDIDSLTLGQIKQLQRVVGCATPQTTPGTCGLEGMNVLVTTSHHLVGWGKLASYDAETKRAVVSGLRCCLYWSRAVSGFTGLSTVGPDADCKVSRATPGRVVLEGVTALAECSAESNAAWKKAPCTK